MSIVTSLTFNAFEENTYVIYDDTRQGIIVDPGCHSTEEENQLRDFINSKDLDIEKIVNTHCHVDHVFGNQYATKTFKAGLYIHSGELPVLQTYPQVARMYGLAVKPSPDPQGFLEEGNQLTFGETVLEILLTPGHSPASISFYNEEEGYIIGGDVLFRGSIGRTDLPGGDMDTLLDSIRKHFLSLPDDTVVYCGHGPSTTIGVERRSNPFLV